MSYFQSKGDVKGNSPAVPPRAEASMPAAKPGQDVVSTIGAGMMITGNIVCTGTLKIAGRVSGDIHVSRLHIAEGAQVDGKIVAQETVIDGAFKGTIHGNSVKLQSTAAVDGEIYNRTLAIAENAQFEGVARRLDKTVEAPSLTAGPKVEAPVQPSAEIVQLTPAE